jgi:PEP-CTERM motif
VATPAASPLPTKSQREINFYKDEDTFLEIATVGLATLASLASPEAAPVFGYLAGLTGADAIGFKLMDPPDYDYTDIATPSPPPVPVLPSSSSCLTATTHPVFTDFSQNSAQIIGLIGAAQTSLNRATGAYLSNAPAYEQLQLNAMNGYISAEESGVLSIANDLNTLSTTLPSACLDPIITAGDITAFQQQLLTNGFSPSDTSTLEGLGLSLTDIEALVSDLTSLDPNLEAGSYPTDFAALASDIIAADPAAVLEPSTFALLGAGLVGLGWFRRRLVSA